MHHPSKLFEVNLSVAIGVHFGNRLVQLLLRVDVSELFTRQQLEQLARVDLAATVTVKHLEGSLQVALPQEGCGVHRRRNELSVVDSAVIIGVSRLEDLHELCTVLAITKPTLKLIKADATVAISVEGLENVLELLDIVRVCLHCNRHQCDLLDLLRFLETLDVPKVEVADLLPVLDRVRVGV